MARPRLIEFCPCPNRGYGRRSWIKKRNRMTTWSWSEKGAFVHWRGRLSKCATRTQLGSDPCRQMQKRCVLIYNGCRLHAEVAIHVVEIESGDAMFAHGAFECGAAIHRFGCVISHIFIIDLLAATVPGNGCATLEYSRKVMLLGAHRKFGGRKVSF